MADGRHVGKYWKYQIRLAMDHLGQNLADRIPSRSRNVRHDVTAMTTTVT